MNRHTSYKKVYLTTDLQSGEKMQVRYYYEHVGMFNIEGEYYAVSDICTHDYGPLIGRKIKGIILSQPSHYSRTGLYPIFTLSRSRVFFSSLYFLYNLQLESMAVNFF